MHNSDFNRVVFFSKEDMAGGQHLSKGELILRNRLSEDSENINDILELYNIKKYIDNKLYLKSWSQEDIVDFNLKAIEYSKIVGFFMSNINDSNIIDYYDQILFEYINSFWELVNNQKIYKQISAENLGTILTNESHLIRTILSYKNIVVYYNILLKKFLDTYSHSAEILLSVYEIKDDFDKKEMFLPKNLTIEDKENIISKYIDSENAHSVYFKLIQNTKNKSNFKISDRIRLKAKRQHKIETDKIFKQYGNNSSLKYAVSICFPKNKTKIKEVKIDNMDANFSYSFDFINQNDDIYSLFLNFKTLFEFVDSQNRIALVSKKSQIGVLERRSLRSQNEYRNGIAFDLSEITSHAQIVSYSEIVNELGNSLENILQLVFTSVFHEKYNFAFNARLLMPSAKINFFEKVRLLAPELETVLKQYKLFVEDGKIDFDLLQISSSPSTIKDIPSLIQNKYIYLNEDNNEIVMCSYLFFSDQTLLTHVEPFKSKTNYVFFDLVIREKVNFNNYGESQKNKINYLINKGFLTLDKDNFIQIKNHLRVLILKDLYKNEVALLHFYSFELQEEANKMQTENMVYFESSLFSKTEQSYFNYFLNKIEFTNGLDLRNSYLHGTQANPEELKAHEYAYFAYLKLLTLLLLKIEDDLLVSRIIIKNI